MTRILRPITCLLAVAVAAVVIAALGPARAATPANGKVSAAAPKTAWSGTTSNSYPAMQAMAQRPQDVPCEAPTCDTFELTVVDPADALELAINVQSTSASQNAGLRVTAPDGTATMVTGASTSDKALKLVLKPVKAGVYTVDTTTNNVNSTTATAYDGAATLVGAKGAAAEPAPQGAPGATATPSPTAAPPSGGGGSGEPPPPPQQQQQQQQSAPPPAAGTFEGFALELKAPRPSARRLRRVRRFSTVVSVSRPVADLELELRRGSRVLAAVSIGGFSGRQRVTVPSGALGAGRYTVHALARDERGVSVARSTGLRVRR